MASGRDDDERKDRDQQILSRLASIQHKVDSLDETQAFALRADAEKHKGTIKEIFRNGRRRAQVYLAADGSRTVADIAEHLGMAAQNVSRELKALFEEGVLEITDTPGRGTVYAKKPVDRTLRITQTLCKDYDLDPNGKSRSQKPAATPKKNLKRK